jgi:hypothetical protein
MHSRILVSQAMSPCITVRNLLILTVLNILSSCLLVVLKSENISTVKSIRLAELKHVKNATPYATDRYQHVGLNSGAKKVFHNTEVAQLFNLVEKVKGVSRIQSDAKPDYLEWVVSDEEAAHTASLHYHHPHNDSWHGTSFSAVTPIHVRRYITPLATSAAVTLSQAMLDDFVFVTAASDIYFDSSRSLIGRVQRLFPNRTIVYYDVGLLANQRQKVRLL